MRHVTIASFGAALGVSGSRLVVTENGQSWETALSRLRTIRVEKKGVSVSSNLILECAVRGIRLYFVDWRGVGVAAVSGLHQHAVVSVREAQFDCVRSEAALALAQEIIFTKIRNQRAVLLYFSKYLNKVSPDVGLRLRQTALELETAAESLRSGPKKGVKEWRNILMGFEGSAATIYWQALRETGFLPPSFCQREGRGSVEIGNAALNYGYAVLQSYVWSALDNCKIQPFPRRIPKFPWQPAQQRPKWHQFSEFVAQLVLHRLFLCPKKARNLAKWKAQTCPPADRALTFMSGL